MKIRKDIKECFTKYYPCERKDCVDWKECDNLALSVKQNQKQIITHQHNIHQKHISLDLIHYPTHLDIELTKIIKQDKNQLETEIWRYRLTRKDAIKLIKSLVARFIK